MKQLFNDISLEEKNRIMEMHKTASDNLYLNEQDLITTGGPKPNQTPSVYDLNKRDLPLAAREEREADRQRAQAERERLKSVNPPQKSITTSRPTNQTPQKSITTSRPTNQTPQLKSVNPPLVSPPKTDYDFINANGKIYIILKRGQTCPPGKECLQYVNK